MLDILCQAKNTGNTCILRVLTNHVVADKPSGLTFRSMLWNLT